MMLGEKIKTARKSAGLTQEQLAQKLMVSRQAVTKWESDKGMPDIENLKTISQLLNVSIDYLLDDGSSMDKSIIREPIDLSLYSKKGKLRCKQDVVVYEKYPDSEIFPLIPNQKCTKAEKIIDYIIGFFTDAPIGIPDLLHSINNMKDHYYLVNKGNKQFFVTVGEDFIESSEVNKVITERKFQRGNMIFNRCNYNLRK